MVNGLNSVTDGTRAIGSVPTRAVGLIQLAMCALWLASCGDGSPHEPAVEPGSEQVSVAEHATQADKDSLASAPRVSNGETKSPSDSVAGRKTIVFIGTSLTAGLGIDLSQAYPAIVGKMLDSAGRPARIINAGVSGETSAGALRRIDWVLRTRADVIVLETGANDGLRGLDLASLRANIEAILDRIRVVQPQAHLMLAQMEAPPNLGARYTTGFHDLFPAIAKEKGVDLLPFLLDGVAGDPSLNQDDGIHPNERGARIVAANVTRALLRRHLP
jgi:acyl-CoA thioesterase-1